MLTILGLVLGNWKLFLYGAIIAGVTGWGAYKWHEQYVRGEAAAIEQVEKANAESMAKAVAAAHTVDACFSAGGTWDRAAGLCLNPTGK